jgi:7-cyano-7-deazaguanine synthase
MKKTAITLLSGGLDSAVATLLARKKYKILLALTFDYGQRAARREIEAASTFCKHYKIRHEVIRLPWLHIISHSSLTQSSKSLPTFEARELGRKKEKEKRSAQAVWVPNRNAIFTNIAAAFAEAKRCNVIVAGFNAEEATTFPDNSMRFIETSNKLFSSSTLSHPRLISPTQKMKKREIARNAVKLKLIPHFFWSCYEGGARMCGQCESCARTIRAFRAIGAWEVVSKQFK